MEGRLSPRWRRIDHSSMRRVALPHQSDGAHQQDLEGQQPTAAQAQPASQNRQAEMVQQRRPKEFEAVGCGDGEQAANGCQPDIGLAQPEGQCGKAQ